MAFEINLAEKFSGPLHLLLELVESQELPLVELSLASVCDSYLEYIEKNHPPAEELTDFLVIATRLLYLKAKSALPQLTEDETETTADLTRQLRAYQICIEWHNVLLDVWKKHRVMYVRPRSRVSSQEPVLPESLFVDDLEKAMNQTLRRLRPFFRIRQTSMERIASLEERIDQLKKAVTKNKQLSFSVFIGDNPKKIDVVMGFLALLELKKSNILEAKQNSLFGDISIMHRSTSI